MEVGVEADADPAETGGSGEYTVHEVNHTVEFKALDAATDVDVPARVVDWLEAKAADLADGAVAEVDA